MYNLFKAIVLFGISIFSGIALILILNSCSEKEVIKPLPPITEQITSIKTNKDISITYSSILWKEENTEEYQTLLSNSNNQMLAFIHCDTLDLPTDDELFLVQQLRKARNNGIVDAYSQPPTKSSWFLIESHYDQIKLMQWSIKKNDKVIEFNCGGRQDMFESDLCQNLFDSIEIK